MSFQQGLSGLNATSKNLDIIGNNIANANTYGAKVARAEFADVYAASLAGAGSSTVGIGTNLAAVAQQFTQGSITTTQNALDLAINGNGFFQLQKGSDPVTYSRNGQFKVDKDGYVVNNAGLRLMGYPADGTGQIQPGQAVALKLPTSGIDPAPTSEIDIEFNLDARQAVTTPAVGAPIDFGDADTYNNATSLTLYDGKGVPVAATFYFQRRPHDAAAGELPDNAYWDVYATANGKSVLPVGAGDPQPVTTIVFGADGSRPSAPLLPEALNIPASTNAAGAETMAIAGIQFDLTRATQFGSPFGVTDMRQDGFAAGQLNAIAIEGNGILMARYSNGQSKAAGQIEIASFRNPQGLMPMGDNGWARSYASGDPIVGVPGDGNLGVLQAGALEESNVDLTAELVNMIVAQRIYQANAQTIKTQDQVLQTMVNLR